MNAMPYLLTVCIAAGVVGAAPDLIKASSLIGLQRGMRLMPKVAPPPMDEPIFEKVAKGSGSLLGLQRAVRVQKGPAISHGGPEQASQVVSSSLAQEVEAAPPHPGELRLADVSLLGLQRSVKAIPKFAKSFSWPIAEDEATDDDMTADLDKLSLASVSVLGLQRSVTVKKRPRVSQAGKSDARQVVSWPVAQEAEAPPPSHPDGLSLADVSLLGLQRSAKIVRRKLPTVSPAAAGEQQAFADASVLGLQRSMRLVRRGL